mmetsp:Transcript_50326/g.102549  ORF Transcript_50326/g.102549 Transcript_50326/m.102549 type:complete len:275 (-) Transcript_50326:121-945(-)
MPPKKTAAVSGNGGHGGSGGSSTTAGKSPVKKRKMKHSSSSSREDQPIKMFSEACFPKDKATKQKSSDVPWGHKMWVTNAWRIRIHLPQIGGGPDHCIEKPRYDAVSKYWYVFVKTKLQFNYFFDCVVSMIPEGTGFSDERSPWLDTNQFVRMDLFEDDQEEAGQEEAGAQTMQYFVMFGATYQFKEQIKDYGGQWSGEEGGMWENVRADGGAALLREFLKFGLDVCGTLNEDGRFNALFEELNVVEIEAPAGDNNTSVDVGEDGKYYRLKAFV